MSENNTRRFSLEEIRAMKRRTDWEHLREAGDHEGEPEFEMDWDSAELVEPAPKKLISLRLDPDIIEFFRSKGKGYQTRMNAVLRSYVEAQRKSG